MRLFWGLSFGHHEAAAVILDGKELVYARKHTGKHIPQSTIGEMSRYGIPDLIYYHQNLWRDFLRKLRVLDFRDLFLEKPILPKKMIQGNHHLSHAASGYYTSGFRDAVVLVADAVGEKECLAVYQASSFKLNTRPLFVLKYPHSLGLFYSYHVAKIGLRPNADENKFMNMASKEMIDLSCLEGYKIVNDNFICERNFHYYPTSIVEDSFQQKQIASSVQYVVEKYVEFIACKYAHLSTNLVFTGGVAYNERIKKKLSLYYENTYTPSHPGDAGSALGAILQHTEEHVTLKTGRIFE